MQLFRPTGLRELQLVLESGLSAWPPRLPDQPIFYPVTTAAYATQIARDWNTKAELRAGYVTEFAVDDDYASQFERRVVGSRAHEELWVPAEQLPEFNRNIRAPIRVIAAFFGDGFLGFIPTSGAFRSKDAREQLLVLEALLLTGEQQLRDEVARNKDAVFLHVPYWRQLAAAQGLMPAVENAWATLFPELPLPTSP